MVSLRRLATSAFTVTALLLALAASSSSLVSARKGKGKGDFGDVSHGKDDSEKFIKEHTGKSEHLTEDEQLYYFFAVHDYNDDNHLDGHELLHALMSEPESHKMSLGELEHWVDSILKDDDNNGDGLISWEEYMASVKDAN